MSPLPLKESGHLLSTVSTSSGAIGTGFHRLPCVTGEMAGICWLNRNLMAVNIDMAFSNLHEETEADIENTKNAILVI